jgi:asparagine synthase (glutamine-hydrolysing)
MMQGADPATVCAAVDAGDPLPGTAGFAGVLDGEPVRDVLGRYPLFSDGEAVAADHRDLDDPSSVPAGTVGGEPVWRLPRPDPYADDQTAVDALRDALDGVPVSVDGEVAVAFSGGLDSAVVAALVDAPLYVAGFPDSHDVAAARSAAAVLDRDLTVVELDRDTVADALPRVAAATGRTNGMDCAIALPLYCTAERAAADGVDVLAVGQGADELFGGYAKVANAPSDPRVDADTVRGATREVVGTLPAQLERDVLALRDAGVQPLAPLLHDAVVRVALALPGRLLVTDRGERKYALRLAARELVPDALAFREKTAVQYGSDVHAELDRLARAAGFRGEDNVGRYAAATVDGD